MLRRPRRNRKSNAIRRLVQETVLTVDDLVYPLFLVDGDNIREEITSLPGNFRLSLDHMRHEVKSAVSLGLHSFMIFPKITDQNKDKLASYSYSKDNYYPDVTLISDVAMDPYNVDGHDGIVENGKILNDASIEVLVKMSLAQAKAGFDILGPSDMMDGRVGAIREALDSEGYENTGIMSYSAKYASAYYGPFRDALDSAPVIDANIPKDKKTYQMNPANKREAIF